MDHIMMVEPKSFEAIVVSFASGCLLHILFYRKGEWDLLALRIFQAYATLPIIVIGLLRLAEFKGWQHDTNLSAVSVLLLEGAHILGLLTSILCYRMIFHPLNKFPGPLRARISNFYPTYLTTKNAHLYEEVEQLHQKYGDFVRLALRDYEPRVTKYTTQLLDRLNEMQGTTINASNWLNFYSFDVMGDLAFGKSFNMLRDGVNHYFLSSLHDSMKMVGALAHISWIIPILKLIPAPPEPLWDLLDYSDTTSATLAGLLFELATNPSQIIKLRDEIDMYFSDREHADHTSLSNLIHLNAVIDESLRLHPPVPSGLQRVTPPQGLMVGDTFIPGNTIVQVPMHTVQRGRYSCVGKQLGLMEVRYVIAHIVRAFDVRLGEGQTQEGFLKSKMDTFTLATPNLHLVFTPRLTK
uniref:Cytochrome P450 n=1 Tax=Fusarium oxysporum (strain Fo5176) TaxID=660025 RepID=A0A0C4DIE3_FUSOF